VEDVRVEGVETLEAEDDRGAEDDWEERLILS